MHSVQTCKPLVWFSTTDKFIVEELTSNHDIHKSIEIADCLRISGKMEEAESLLDKIDLRINAVDALKGIDTKKLRSLIASNDSTSETVIENSAAGQLPPLWIRGVNLAGAFARWAGAGFKMRTQEQIDERLAICQACDKFNGDACSVCGCNCNATGLLNKLALASESCPEGKWK